MNYLIQAFNNNDKQILGSNNSGIVKNAKSMVKIDNRLRCFNPCKETTTIKVFSYSNLYDKSSYNLVKTISVSF